MAGEHELRALIDGGRDAIHRVIADLREKAEVNERIRDAEHRACLAELRQADAARADEQRRQIGDLSRRVDERLSAVRNGNDGRDGAQGERGQPGESVDPQVVRSMVEQAVKAAISQIPPAEPGAPGTDGQDGKDAEPFDDTAIRHAEELRAARFDAFLAEQRHALSGLTAKAEAAVAVVKDGRDGIDGKDGAPGADGHDGRDGRDGIDGKDGAPGERGSDGSDGKDGVDGRDGKDAYAGEARGLFDAEAAYRAMDVVSFNGSEWRAKRDDPGALPGDGWMLSASKGKRGDRGERGPQGADGVRGKDGASIIAAFVDDEMQLTITRDDGTEVTADLYPLAETVRSAAVRDAERG